MAVSLGAALRAALLLALLGAPTLVSAQPPAEAPPPDPAQEQSMPGMPGMPEGTREGGHQMGSMPMGSMQPMTCTCPSAFGGAGGIAALVLGALVAVSAAAALIALTVFLLRRSRRATAA